MLQSQTNHWTAYQIYFGIFFHNALMFLRIIPVPAVTLSIIVQVKLYLRVFVWSYACACVLCSNFSGPLLRQRCKSEGKIILHRYNIVYGIRNLLEDGRLPYPFYLQAVLLLVRHGTTIFTSSLTKFSGDRILFGENIQAINCYVNVS